ncbi:hypothetical protein D2E65_08505 [Mycobacteroides abscessus]|nr:hypothetical protein D2E65_08505 [Mycobacteroides abscessus]RIS08643.1 hypothetical protein D2E58_01990 [Mycobacteroides abscessus]RIS61284.1 hypothetical protein D2E46_19475 [Mycobacteroides abscessus]RIS65777.1 hypothetical protein D2E43_01760 [Mycobacteroides abscessus]
MTSIGAVGEQCAVAAATTVACDSEFIAERVTTVAAGPSVAAFDADSACATVAAGPSDAHERSGRATVAAVCSLTAVAARSAVADCPGCTAVASGNTGYGAVPAASAVAE